MIAVVIASLFAGAAGGIMTAALLALWATGPAVEDETVLERAHHARDVVAACRRRRAWAGRTDPYKGIAYRTDDPRRKGVA